MPDCLRVAIEVKMNQEQRTVGYDEFFLKPTKERIRIFNEISPENRALLVKTQAERWLASNRSRLTSEQVAVVEEIIRSISSEWYREKGDFEEIAPEAEVLRQKVEAILSREDLIEFSSERAKYIPVVGERNEQ